jgi:hypothetical protein
MSNRIPAFAAAPLAALLVLAACEPETVTADEPVDPQAEALRNAPAVAPPPMIQSSRTWRCKDNSLLYADFYTNGSVRVRTEKGGEFVTLTAAGGQPPFTAEGYSLSANADQISYTAPGKGTRSCRR